MLKICNVTNISFYIQRVQENIAEIFFPRKNMYHSIIDMYLKTFVLLFVTKNTHKQRSIIITSILF